MGDCELSESESEPDDERYSFEEGILNDDIKKTKLYKDIKIDAATIFELNKRADEWVLKNMCCFPERGKYEIFLDMPELGNNPINED